MEIRGTSDLRIFQKEKLSLRPASFYINKLGQIDRQNALEEFRDNQYSIYKENLILPSVYQDSPIPYLFKSFSRVNFRYSSALQTC